MPSGKQVFGCRYARLLTLASGPHYVPRV